MLLKIRNYSLSSLSGLLKFNSNNMEIKYIVVAYFIICNECENIFLAFSRFVSCLQVNASLYIDTNYHEIPIPYSKDFCLKKNDLSWSYR